jgi:periplasmic protein TonB
MAPKLLYTGLYTGVPASTDRIEEPMFNTLLESKPARGKRTVGGAAISVVAHTAIIFFAVYATANARIAEAPRPTEENIKFVQVKPEEPKPEPPKAEPPPQRSQPKAAATPPPAPRIEAPAPVKGFQTIQAPINVPVTLPDIDLGARVTEEADFSGKGIAGGTGSGSAGGAPGGTGTGTAPDLSQPFREHQVEIPVSALGNVSPDYPPSLRETGVEGQVVAEFVVLESGRVDMSTLRIIETSNALFTASVRSALPRMRFSPARIGGTAVKQYVRQPFTFRLTRS